MKISYRALAGYEGTAYVDDEPHPEFQTHTGTNKHTDEDVTVFWNGTYWEEVQDMTKFEAGVPLDPEDVAALVATDADATWTEDARDYAGDTSAHDGCPACGHKAHVGEQCEFAMTGYPACACEDS